PNSLEVLSDSRIEPALAHSNAEEAIQFERQGYFCHDEDSAPGRPVFNRTVGLRDTWAKVSGGGGGESPPSLGEICGRDGIRKGLSVGGAPAASETFDPGKVRALGPDRRRTGT